jgi:hypothetical protein
MGDLVRENLETIRLSVDAPQKIASHAAEFE